MELLLHHAPIAGPLCWSFCLGRQGGLYLRVCRFLLPWPWLAEDRIVLGDVSRQLGPSLFILERFFFLGVGLVLDMRWAGVAKSFGPTLTYNIYFVMIALKIKLRHQLIFGVNGIQNYIFCLLFKQISYHTHSQYL